MRHDSGVDIFAPANDSFMISTERKTYGVREAFTLNYPHSSGFAALTDEEQRELSKLGAPLLRGEIPTSIRLALKP